jgi:hypothetical protein
MTNTENATRNLQTRVETACHNVMQWRRELVIGSEWTPLWQACLKTGNLRLELSTCSDLCRRVRDELQTAGQYAQNNKRVVPQSNAITIAAQWTEKRLRAVVRAKGKETVTPVEDVWTLQSIEQSSQLIDDIDESLILLCGLEKKLRQALLSLSPSQFDTQAIQRRVEILNNTLIKNNRDTLLSDHEETRRAFELVHQSRFLKRLCAHLDGHTGTYQADLISETFSMGEVEWYQYALKKAELNELYETVYRGSLEREVASFESAVNDFVNIAPIDTLVIKEQLPKVWRCLLWGGELQVTVHVSPIVESEVLVQRCANARDSLRRLVESFVSQMSDTDFTESFTELSWDLLYYASDLMSEMDHTSLHCSIFRLSSVEYDLQWYLSWEKLQKLSNQPNEHFQASLKRLIKQSHWVQIELQEKRLQSRLESIFGQKFVTRFEQLLFFLIFLVLGLLFYEFVWVAIEDKETRRTLALIDTGICAVFLSEFFLKLALVQKRWFYFKRRWFIDLLPSIPFVYFTDYLFVEYMMAGRSAKLARISRLARYIRVIRPFIRIIRLVSFTLRGMDRLVRRYSQWLNHNLVFFEPSQSIYHRPEQSEFEKANVVYAKSLSLSRQLTAQLSTEELAPLLPAYLITLQEHLNGEHAPLSQQQLEGEISIQRLKEVPVEHAIHTLIHLQGAELEAHLGYNFPKRLHSIMGLFDLPLVNRIPLLRDVLLKRRHSTASEFAAWWIRSFGKFLETLMSLGYWFADLYGVVTGPKLIDRVGSTLVRSFERPAKRLMIFGGLLITLQFLVSGLGVKVLSNLVLSLQKFVGLPMIVIGSICLVPLLLGKWMKRIADQAEELYRLTAEAQFINLLKDLKELTAEDDLTLIYDRVIYAEERLWGIANPDLKKQRKEQFIRVSATELKAPLLMSEDAEAKVELLSTLYTPHAFSGSQHSQEELIPATDTPSAEHDLYWLDRRLDLLYRDYLDGAILHQSDIKTTEQLMGNLSLRSLFDYKLNLTTQEKKEIDRLDLATHRSLIGPFMWFSLITQSVSQASAQLVIDYNRYIIPKSQLNTTLPASRELFNEWLKHKRGEGLSYSELEERKRSLPPFNTTDISVLQILASKENHHEEIKTRFGEEVLELLNTDQKRLIRGIFSSYPLHQLPKPMRTLNPYLLYNEFIQGGKVFTLPFRILALIFGVIVLALRWTKEKIDEIRFPDQIRSEIVPQKDYVVAQRKIDRMRKPVFIKLLHLRAQLDFAYLGLSVEGLEPLNDQGEEPHVKQDLDLIKAIEVERLPITDQIESTQSSLREFHEYLKARGYTGKELHARLKSDFPDFLPRSREVKRAIITAYLADFKDLQSYLQTKIKLTELFTDSLNGLPNIPFKLHKRVLLSAGRATKRIVHRGEDREKMGFSLFWKHLGFFENNEQEFDLCWQRYLVEARDLQPLLIKFAQDGLPEEDLVLEEVIRTTPMWTDELVTLRCIQTFSLMDIENYRRYIWSVGSYEEDLYTEDVDIER